MNEHHHKMYHYEVQPPAACWDRIASELDASDMVHSYPSTLRNSSVTPPPTAWENITAALDENRKRPFPVPFLRFAAAAAVIAALAWGGIKLLNTGSRNEKPEVAVTPPTNKPGQLNTNPATELPDTPVSPAELEIAEARNDAALEQSKRTYAAIDLPSRSKIRNVSNFFFIPDAIPDGGTRGIDFDEPDNEPAGDNAERYITLMTPDGNIIRMSRKLSDLVCCVSGEEQDDDCIEQMKKWRQQLVNPSHGHAAGSFMDILGLLKSMQDDQL